ncbi:M48 family metallopeptidase [Puniceicoccaceae bacterium K14]|nr:M48 family metallopeptidase [Puniceicoccaceae bacterium K14]
MTTINGKYYLAGSSDACPALLSLSQDSGVEITAFEEVLEFREPSFRVEPALGSTPRIIRFHDGSMFETSEFEKFNALEKQLGTTSFTASLIKKLEERWRSAILSVFAVIVFCILFYLYGIPLAASKIAETVPQSMRAKMSEDTMALMQKITILRETNIDDERRAELEEIFFDAISRTNLPKDEGYEYKLTFKDAPAIGKNAFALPSGEIVVTDALVEVCSDDQLRAILLHEIGHVELQHGIRSVIQDTGILIIISLAIGDANGVSSIVSALPALLAESHYSQKFEIESDTFSCKHLQQQGYNPDDLADALQILHTGTPDMPFEDLVSTHPSLKQRLENIKENTLKVSP